MRPQRLSLPAYAAALAANRQSERLLARKGGISDEMQRKVQGRWP